MEKHDIIEFMNWVSNRFNSTSTDNEFQWYSVVTATKHTSEEIYDLYEKQSHLNYDTITEEQLEEFVEVIDWTRIPSKLITNNIINKFSFIGELRARIWFENIIKKGTVIRNESIMNSIFEFHDNNQLILKVEGNTLMVNKDIGDKFFSEFGMRTPETFWFIKTLMSNHLNINLFIQKFFLPTIFKSQNISSEMNISVNGNLFNKKHRW